MCIYYGIKLWISKGGKLLFTFQPNFHVMVCSPTGIFHGTNRRGGWTIEKIDAEAFTRWLIST